MKRLGALVFVAFVTIFVLSTFDGKENGAQTVSGNSSVSPTVRSVESTPQEEAYYEFELAQLPADYDRLARVRVLEIMDSHPDLDFRNAFGKLLHEGLIPVVVLSEPKRKAKDGAFVAAVSFAVAPEHERGVWPKLKVNPRVFLNPRVPKHVLWRTMTHESVHVRQFLYGRLPILPPGVIREYTQEEAVWYFEVEAGAHRVENEVGARYGWPADSEVDLAFRAGGVPAMRVALAKGYCEMGWHPVHCELFKAQALRLPN